MTLELYMHPLSSYCHKALIALYENDVAFDPVIIDRSTVEDFKKLWPIGKFPLLRDVRRDHLIPESTIIIEYLDLHYPGKVKLLPGDPDRARQVRMRDRFFDLYLHAPMQKYPGDWLRPSGNRDPYGVEEAKRAYRIALDMLESELVGKTWVMGEEFTMADCAAAPALYYGERFYGPFRESHPVTMAYLDRLMARSSYARVLQEAKPYLHPLPG
jgi:glutathione S-transferase